jgi:hypothetical protein
MKRSELKSIINEVLSEGSNHRDVEKALMDVRKAANDAYQVCTANGAFDEWNNEMNYLLAVDRAIKSLIMHGKVK